MLNQYLHYPVVESTDLNAEKRSALEFEYIGGWAQWLTVGIICFSNPVRHMIQTARGRRQRCLAELSSAGQEGEVSKMRVGHEN